MSIVVIGGRPCLDVEKNFKLSQSSSAATTNRTKLQDAADGTNYRYPWFFPGGSNYELWQTDDVLVLPADQARVWEGVGFGFRNGSTHRGSVLCLRAADEDSTVRATLFDGSTNKLTTSGASATVTVVGRTVSELDRYGSVEITAGTNAIAGWYGIESVNVGANSWTLDRACTSNTSTNLQGYYCPTVVRNLGSGHVVRGMSITSIRLGDDEDFGHNGSIGYHIASSGVSGVAGATGNHTFENCTFDAFDSGILLGRHMARAYGSVAGWVGYDDNQADHLTLIKCRFGNVKSGIHARNLQAVVHSYHHVRFSSLRGYAFNFDAAGKLFADTVEVSGEAANTPQCILRLGPEARRGHSPYVIQNFSFDGSNTRNPQLVVVQCPSNSTQESTVLFQGGIINRTDTHDDFPLIDVQGRRRITVSDVGRASGGGAAFWPGSIVVKEAAAGYEPYVILRNVCLTYTSTPQELIRNTSTGGKVKLVDCYKTDGTLVTDQVLDV